MRREEDWVDAEDILWTNSVPLETFHPDLLTCAAQSSPGWEYNTNTSKMQRKYACEENITKLKCLLDEMIAMITAHLFFWLSE